METHLYLFRVHETNKRSAFIKRVLTFYTLIQLKLVIIQIEQHLVSKRQYISRYIIDYFRIKKVYCSK